MAHAIEQQFADQRGEGFAYSVAIAVGFLLLKGNGVVILLVVMQALFQIFRGNGLMIVRDVNRTGDIEDMADEGWGEGDISIDRSTAFFLEDAHAHLSCS